MFEPTVESLKQYQCPEWFRDAKFGIYLHWGVYSVAERGEWYPRQMYIEGDAIYEHHVKTWGHPSKFGYKDFIPMWQAENFDPDRLVGLFQQAGAKYFTPCAVHHDNFDLWDSKHHRYNSVNFGPKKDITGLWREAALRAGLRWGVTTHLERTWSWFQTNKGADKAGPLAGVPYDGHDPAWTDFYLPPDPAGDDDRRHPRNAPKAWRDQWALRIKDLIDNYQPDHLYFDGGVPFLGDDQGQTGLDVIAHFYNRNAERHGGVNEGVMCVKRDPKGEHGFFWPGVTTLDIERGRADELLPDPWQTDTSIGPWGYHTGREYRPVKELVHELIDIVSKNGNVLLNVPPKADGTLDAATEEILAGLGSWLGANGEAVYGTRPWTQYGELIDEGEVRFTQKGDTIFAILLADTVERQPVTFPALGADKIGKLDGISLLGSDEPVSWQQADQALNVVLPAASCEHAAALRCTLMA